MLMAEPGRANSRLRTVRLPALTGPDDHRRKPAHKGPKLYQQKDHANDPPFCFVWKARTTVNSLQAFPFEALVLRAETRPFHSSAENDFSIEISHPKQ